MEVRPGPSARVRHELTDSCLSVGLVTRDQTIYTRPNDPSSRREAWTGRHGFVSFTQPLWAACRGSQTWPVMRSGCQDPTGPYVTY